MRLKPGKYQKRPIVVEAVRWLGDPEGAIEIASWVNDNGGTARLHVSTVGGVRHQIAIDTLEGIMNVSAGDWVVRGAVGEFYPVKAQAFSRTFEDAPEQYW